jgi:hypothetical protein
MTEADVARQKYFMAMPVSELMNHRLRARNIPLLSISTFKAISSV